MPLWIAIFMDVLGYTLLIPLFPTIKVLFSATNFQVAALMSVNAFFTIIFGLLLGKLSDKFGRKPILLISQIGTLVGFVVFAFSNSLTMLYISRIIDGCFGGNFPVCKAIVSDSVPFKDRSKQMANISVVFALSNVIGPGMCGLLSTIGSGLIGPGMFGVVLSAISIIITIFLIKETSPIKTGKLLLGEKTIETEKIDLLVSSDRRISRNKTAMILLTQFGFHALALMIIYSNMTLFGNEKLGLTTVYLGILLSIAGLFQIVFRFTVFPLLLKHLGEKKFSTLGLGLFIIDYALIGFVNNEWQLVLAILGHSLAATVSRGILISFISRSVDPRDQGKIQGLSSGLDTLAQLFGPLIGGFIISNCSLYWYGLVPAIIAIIPFAMGFIPLRFKGEETRYEKETTKIPQSVIPNASGSQESTVSAEGRSK